MTNGHADTNHPEPQKTSVPYVYFAPGEVIFGIEIVPPINEIDIFRSKSQLATAITTSIKAATQLEQAFDVIQSTDQEIPQWPLLLTSTQSAILHVKLMLSNLGDQEVLENRAQNRERLASYVSTVANELMQGFDMQGADTKPISVSEIPGIPLMSNGVEVARIRTVMPNWVSRGAPSQIGTGGPGGSPKEATDASGTLTSFVMPKLDGAISNFLPGNNVSGSIDRPIDVYVLDTVPPLEEDNLGCTRMPLNPVSPMVAVANEPVGKYDNHPLVDSLRSCLIPVTEAGAPKHYVTTNGKLTLTYADDLQKGSFDAIANHQIDVHEKFESVEHGTFIAGIIMQMAPNANVHLIEVLNAKGVGTAESVLAGLAEVARRHGKSENAIAIVNCSFTFALPILTTDRSTSHIVRELPKSLFNFLQGAKGQFITETFFSGMIPTNDNGRIVSRFSSLIEPSKRFRVVAASGNDSDRNGQNKIVDATAIPPTVGEPRYPARYRSVLGVGALTQQGGNIANYSNQADIPEKDGLLTLGEIKGVFTKELPSTPTGSPLRTGFVTWKGTSFAAAVISGMLAKVCYECHCEVDRAETIIRDAQINKIGSSEIIDASQPSSP